MTFRSVEHAYQFRKAIEMSQEDLAEEIRQTHSSYNAMEIAKNIRTGDKWLDMKMSIIYELLKVKADQSKVFYNKLISTKGRQLVEDTSHDYWGKGSSGTGLNMLGRLLMTLRDTYNPKYTNVPPSNYSYPQQGMSQTPNHAYSSRSQNHTRILCKEQFTSQSKIQYGKLSFEK